MNIFEKQGYRNLKKRFLISIIILIIAIIAFIIIFFLFFPKACNDNACFVESLADCDRVSFLKEDSNASWYYIVNGRYNKDSCKVKVKLLRLNQGTIDIEDLEGSEMTCIVSPIDSMPPEENIKNCNGLLREKLQEIIIQRMHNYLLKNLGQIQESFGGV